MARGQISVLSWANNRLQSLTTSFTALATDRGWYVDPGNVNDDLILVAYSTHTSAVPITISAGTSEMNSTSYTGCDFIGKVKGDLSTSISSSGISVLFIDSARFKSTGGLYIDATSTGSSAIQWCGVFRKPKL